MILLTDIATKLNQLLNSANNPVDFEYNVRVAGFHIDSIDNRKTGKNNILVFVDSLGGDYNPVQDLDESNFNVQMSFYFPVRFKDEMYKLNGYLKNIFVGKRVNFGLESGSPICNISVAEYGEIIGTDLDKFKEWVEETYENATLYKDTMGIYENYMSMNIKLYTSQIGENFMFGNDVSFRVSASLPSITPNKIIIHKLNIPTAYIEFTRDADEDITLPDGTILYAWVNEDTYKYTKTTEFEGGDKTFNNTGVADVRYVFFRVSEYNIGSSTQYTEDLVWTGSGTGGSITPISQQVIGKDNFVKNISNLTQFNKSIIVYPDMSKMLWKRFVALYNIQRLDTITNIIFFKIYKTASGIKNYQLPQKVLSINENIDLGQPLSYTIVFGDGE